MPFSLNNFQLKQPSGVLLSEAMNYLIIPINSLRWKKENIECSVSKLQGLLGKRILRSQDSVGDPGWLARRSHWVMEVSPGFSDCGGGGGGPPCDDGRTPDKGDEQREGGRVRWGLRSDGLDGPEKGRSRSSGSGLRFLCGVRAPITAARKQLPCPRDSPGYTELHNENHSSYGKSRVRDPTLKNIVSALAGVAQWVEPWPSN